MPYLPKTPCRARNCPELAGKSGYCPRHNKERWQEVDNNRDPIITRLRNSQAWRKLREIQLRLHPLCVSCGKPATTVDHITPHKGNAELFFNQDNLQSMCKSCHNAKTIRENIDK